MYKASAQALALAQVPKLCWLMVPLTRNQQLRTTVTSQIFPYPLVSRMSPIQARKADQSSLPACPPVPVCEAVLDVLCSRPASFLRSSASSTLFTMSSSFLNVWRCCSLSDRRSAAPSMVSLKSSSVTSPPVKDSPTSNFVSSTFSSFTVGIGISSVLGVSLSSYAFISMMLVVKIALSLVSCVHLPPSALWIVVYFHPQVRSRMTVCGQALAAQRRLYSYKVAASAHFVAAFVSQKLL